MNSMPGYCSPNTLTRASRPTFSEPATHQVNASSWFGLFGSDPDPAAEQPVSASAAAAIPARAVTSRDVMSFLRWTHVVAPPADHAIDSIGARARASPVVPMRVARGRGSPARSSRMRWPAFANDAASWPSRSTTTVPSTARPDARRAGGAAHPDRACARRAPATRRAGAAGRSSRRRCRSRRGPATSGSASISTGERAVRGVAGFVPDPAGADQVPPRRRRRGTGRRQVDRRAACPPACDVARSRPPPGRASRGCGSGPGAGVDDEQLRMVGAARRSRRRPCRSPRRRRPSDAQQPRRAVPSSRRTGARGRRSRRPRRRSARVVIAGRRTRRGCRAGCRGRARPTVATGQAGRVPVSAHAACTAAPSRHVLAGCRARTTGTSNTCAAIADTAGFCAAPPMSRMRRASTPCARTASRPSASPHSIPSMAARARFSRVVDGEGHAEQGGGGVGQVRGALALEVRLQHETARHRARRRGRAGRVRRGRRRAGRRSRRGCAPRSAWRPAAGRRRVASAKPATAPEASAVGGRR